MAASSASGLCQPRAKVDEDEKVSLMATEIKRRDSRKGNEQRIGIGNRGRADVSTDGYLIEHKRPRAMSRRTRELVTNGIKQDRVCGLLDDQEIETILATMEFYEFNPEEAVIKQGEVGTTFFVTHDGTLEVSVNGRIVNTLSDGASFGGLALLYNCPRTATVTAIKKSFVWGASGDTFHEVLRENGQRRMAENRIFLDSIALFDGLSVKQKDRVMLALVSETAESGERVITEGEAAASIYFVKVGELCAFENGAVNPNGELVGGTEVARFGPGDCFGERQLLAGEVPSTTVIASVKCELLCIKAESLKEVLGKDLGACLERNFILFCMKQSPVISQFSCKQLYGLLEKMSFREYSRGTEIEDEFSYFIVIDGEIRARRRNMRVTLCRGQWHDKGSFDGGTEHESITDMLCSSSRARLAVLTREGLNKCLEESGLLPASNPNEAPEYTRKMLLVKKVHIFRYLSDDQTSRVIRSFVSHRFRRGALVIRQGDIGTAFFVIASGEVTIYISNQLVRTLGRNAYFGERALLFDEPRTATVKVESRKAELWSIEKSTWCHIVTQKMRDDMLNRIQLQETSMTLKELKQEKVIGVGAAGVVRLVQHKTRGMRYALKRVLKSGGTVPEEVRRECDLLAENNHPFIMTLVKTFETDRSIYLLTELITGGELHAAIRRIPTVLSRSQARFYGGSLVLVLEELADRNIVYRDLKPENVMLDNQGYVKLIDFGIAKKLDKSKSKTFTMIGTPHYMAPDIIKGHGYGTEVDIWSLGVMIYEFVCGTLPFADDLDDPMEICSAVLRENLSFPSHYRDRLGESLIRGLLCRQPKKRLGLGIDGFEDIKKHEYFVVNKGSLFESILGRELDAPVVPEGETYCSLDDMEPVNISDVDELG